MSIKSVSIGLLKIRLYPSSSEITVIWDQAILWSLQYVNFFTGILLSLHSVTLQMNNAEPHDQKDKGLQMYE